MHKDPERRRESRRERYARLRAAGICSWCTNPAEEGHYLCTKHRQEMRDGQRRRAYGLSQQQLDALKAIDHCSICGAPATEIDHDHESGQVRGVLCHHCNLMLGHAKDNPEVLRAAADYLERSL